MANSMKTGCIGLCLSAGIVFVSACAQKVELAVPETSGRMLYATFSESDDTKASLEDGVTLIWHAGDTISVFENNTGRRYRFNGATGDTEGTFSDDETDLLGASTFSHTYAVYPYRKAVSCSDEGEFAVEVPSVQHYTVNSFDPAANVMGAVTGSITDPKIKFRNALGYLRVKLYGGDILKSITFRGNSGEVISGSACLSLSSDEAPAITMTGTGTEIVIDCGSGVVLPGSEAEALTFWIALPPITFENGFTIDIKNSLDEVMTKQTTSKVSIVRNYAKGIKAIAASLSGGTDFLSFFIKDNSSGNEYPAYDLEGPDITVCVPYGFDLKTAKASFTVNGLQVYIGEDEQISGETSNDFSEYMSPLQYRIVGMTGLEKTYNVRVIDTKLPVVYISTPEHAPVLSKDEWVEGGTICIGKPGKVPDDLGIVKIRGRGNTSWSGQDKKPYRIKLEKKSKVLGMPKHKSWQLLNCFGMSPSYFRDDLMFEMARRTASHGWAPSGVFAEVVLNGKFVGMYWVCEKISVDKNRLNITEIQPEDIEYPNITGGYLMEYAKGDEWSFKSTQYKYSYFVKTPDEDVPDEQYYYIRDYINKLEYLLKDDESFACREYKDSMDVDSWIDYWFLHEMANATDLNLPLYPGMSCFCYKDRGGKLKAGPVWDMHMSKKTGFHADTALYYKRLFQDEEFVDRVKEKWYGSESEKGFIERMDNVIIRVDSIAPLIEHSGNRDMRLWSKTGSIAEQAVQIKDFYNNNISWLDEHIATDK